MHRTLVCVLVCVLVVASCGGTPSSVLDAGKVARTSVTDRYTDFKIVSEHEIEASKKSHPVEVEVEDGRCYRFVLVRAGESTEEIDLAFKHPKIMLESGTDVFDLTPEDVDPTTQAIGGMCVWPTSAGTIKVFHNVDSSGGFLVVASARASKLSWKQGEDIKLYLASIGELDLEKVEKEEAESRIVEMFAADQSTFQGYLEGRNPFMNDMMATTDTTWQTTFDVAQDTCYHLFLGSPNCILKYEIRGAENDKKIHHDGAPKDVGRFGWGHDFCPVKKHFGGQAEVTVQLMKVTDDFEKCWLGAALYRFELSKKQMKKMRATVNKARAAARSQTKACGKARKACKKGCAEDPACEQGCMTDYSDCTKKIVFEGEIQPAGAR
jgi:hypothetical protein